MKTLLPILISLLAMTMDTSCSRNNVAPNAEPTKGSVTTQNVEQFQQTIEQKSTLLVDVRTPKEFAEGHIANAINIDVNQPDFGNNPTFGTAKKSKPIAVYCRSGKRSLKAANILSEKGFTVYNLGGGILAWQQSGKPTIK